MHIQKGTCPNMLQRDRRGGVQRPHALTNGNRRMHAHSKGVHARAPTDRSGGVQRPHALANGNRRVHTCPWPGAHMSLARSFLPPLVVAMPVTYRSNSCWLRPRFDGGGRQSTRRHLLQDGGASRVLQGSPVSPSYTCRDSRHGIAHAVPRRHVCLGAILISGDNIAYTFITTS